MRLVIDTNRYSDMCRGDRAVLGTIEKAREILMPFVVVGELRAGFTGGTRGPQNEAILSQFLTKPATRVLYADDQTTHFYANVYRQLRVQGTPIPTNDMWIAALTLQHSLTLFARDAHFDHLPQLARI